jgi:hypothetical protein
VSALETFRKAVEHAEREGIIVTLSRQTARAILDEIDGVDKVMTTAPALKLGDTVKVIQTHSRWHNRVGTIMNIEPHAREYPYSVDFSRDATDPRGWRTEVAYFSQSQLEKV